MTSKAIYKSFKRGDGLLDDFDGFAKLGLSDDQGRGEANDVLMGGLGQQAEVAHLEAHIPSLFAIFWLNDDGVQQAFTTHLLDHRALNLADLLAEDLTETFGVLHQMFFLDNLKGGDGHASCDWVTAKG